MNNTNIFAIMILFIITSCTHILPYRSYEDTMSQEDMSFFSAGRDFPIVPGDSENGRMNMSQVKKRTPASEYEVREQMHRNSLTRELNRRKSSLTEAEFDDFRRTEDYLTDISEKIYYLSLPRGERVSYLKYRGFNEPGSNRRGTSILDARSVKSEELYVGMSKNMVVKSWGRPVKVDIAGNPRHQNERWSFYKGGRVNQVFFEKGRVQGWVIE